ncbi:MAG: hypothetical protein KKD73_01825 [Proteobacteria bacterium]|nr:hypothetical protein [Pseudomonadota bacterium]MBU1640109.1 hypothetical protein [Pseudomonadota bacterium]
MKINLFFDNNAWDILFDAQIDLIRELPDNEFSLNITREAEFEIPLMPSGKREYVENVISKGKIITDRYFGFYDESLPFEEQRAGGFGDINNPSAGGRFIDERESALMASEANIVGPTKRPTGLFKNEADVSLAARSLHSVVLTCDGKKSLKRAKNNHGGMIVDLKMYRKGQSLAGFIRSELARIKKQNALMFTV